MVTKWMAADHSHAPEYILHCWHVSSLQIIQLHCTAKAQQLGFWLCVIGQMPAQVRLSRVSVCGGSAVMGMLDQGEQDDKIIAVHADDPEFKGFTDVSQLPKHRLMEIRRYAHTLALIFLMLLQSAESLRGTVQGAQSSWTRGAIALW